MNKKKSISKLFIGAFFLAIYCNVMFTQLFCNYSHLIDLAGTEHEHPQGHDHPHSDVAMLVSQHNQDDSHKYEISKEDNCCNDNTSEFFASQTNPTTASFEFKNTFFTEFISFSNNVFTSIKPLITFEGYFSELPPPKIPDIRIFIHSFLI